MFDQVVCINNVVNNHMALISSMSAGKQEHTCTANCKLSVFSCRVYFDKTKHCRYRFFR